MLDRIGSRTLCDPTSHPRRVHALSSVLILSAPGKASCSGMGPGRVLIPEIERNSGPEAVGAGVNRGSWLIIIVSGNSRNPLTYLFGK